MTLIRNRYLLSSERNTIVLIVQRAIRALPATRRLSGDQEQFDENQ
jgi:hypothetical protein